MEEIAMIQPRLAPPEEVSLLMDLYHTGNIPYTVSASEDDDAEPADPTGTADDESLEEIEVTEECDQGRHEDCEDIDCECDCHDDETDVDDDEDDDLLDDDDDLEDDDDDDLLDDDDDDEEE